ncbi:hypothetical protein [Fulvimarina sp. MAC3]|uniref:hypothetical protein n=1 Tax=Fulvimarina sp. MAC3 TaxID=3148887 RepID=UPI0031FE1728
MAEKFNSSLADELRTSVMRQAGEINPQLALDVAGIFDPTPISDAASTGLSLWNGELIDAALGGVSMVPYLGDALAKPFKIIRKYGEPAVKVVDGAVSWLRGGTERMVAALREIEPAGVQRARERAAEAVRNAQARKRANCNTEECKSLRKSRMPKNGGRWDPPDARETGDGTWHFTDVNGNARSVPYKNGYPDFSNHFKGGGPYEISNPTGDVGHDTTMLFKEKHVPQPRNTTLHHLEDGRVAFVDSSVHDAVPHTGFRAIQNTELF